MGRAIEYYKKGIDQTLLDMNLRLTLEAISELELLRDRLPPEP